MIELIIGMLFTLVFSPLIIYWIVTKVYPKCTPKLFTGWWGDNA